MEQALNHSLMWAIFGRCHNAAPQGQGRVDAGARVGNLLSGAVTRDMLRLEDFSALPTQPRGFGY